MLWLRHVDAALFVCMLHSLLGLCLHVTVEGCHSIRYPMCASRYSPVIEVRHSDSLMVVVAAGPDGFLITIPDLVVFLSLSQGGSHGCLFAVSLSVAPGMLPVDH